MSNTLDPKLEPIRRSDQNPSQEATHVCRLLGLLTHNPESIRSLLQSPIDSVDEGGPVLAGSASGTSEDTGTVSVTMADAPDYAGAGTGLELDVTYGLGVYTVEITDPGDGYVEAETIVFPGTLFGGGEVQTVTKAGTSNDSGTDVPVTEADASSQTGDGTGLALLVSYAAGVYTVTVADGGTGFVHGDILVFPGDLFEGTSPTNDLTVTINNVFGETPTNDFTFTVDSVERLEQDVTDAKYLLLSKLESVRDALDAVDPSWEAEWDDNSNDLTEYSPSAEVETLGALIQSKDFGGATNDISVETPEDTENTN